jgi:hypothetical protein
MLPTDKQTALKKHKPVYAITILVLQVKAINLQNPGV